MIREQLKRKKLLQLGDIVICNNDRRYLFTNTEYGKEFVRIGIYKDFSVYDDNLFNRGNKDDEFTVKYIFRPIKNPILNIEGHLLKELHSYLFTDDFLRKECNKISDYSNSNKFINLEFFIRWIKLTD